MKAHRFMLWTALLVLGATALLCAMVVWQTLERGQPVVAAVGAAVGALVLWLAAFTVRTLLWDVGRLSWKTRGRA